jgi:hypothetical protein
MESGKKAKRAALYRRNEVRRLINSLLKGKGDLRPQRDPVAGDYIFEVEGLSSSKASALLQDLDANGILEKYRLDSAPTCPTCDHSNFYVNYACPFCQHRDVERATMIEHYSCGHTDFESSFKSGEKLVCPKCGRELKLIGTDYRKMERVYHCLSCKRYFGTPSMELACRTCEKVISTDMVNLTPTFGYRLNDEIRDELVTHCSLEGPIIDFLERFGYETKVPWSEKGISGTEHTFDIHARREGSEIVIDITSCAEDVGPESVVAFFGKVYDLNHRRAILLAMPRLNRDAERLSSLYKSEVVSGASIEELIRNFSELLGNGIVEAPRPEMVKKDPFDAPDLCILHEETTTVLEKNEGTFKVTKSF